ncbi:MAG: hypothetical protein ACXVA9_03925 [Bdellovibrionales bacterium]
MKKSRKPRKFAVNKYQTVPTLREHDLITAVRNIGDAYPLTRVIQNSYVLSRFWAWFSQIQLEPRVRIPVPRFLSVRDP